MEFTPRYPQPFTMQEALALDVPVITEEITRLQNSLIHLKDTQNTLQECIAEDTDPELTKAFEENQVVIGSQEERIRMLKFALNDKGIHFNEHYDLDTTKQLDQHQHQQSSVNGTSTQPRIVTREDRTTGLEDEDDGLHL